MKTLLSISFFFIAVSVLSQNRVRMDIVSLPGHHLAGSSIYIAGSFNGWNPQDDKYRFQQDEKGNYFITLSLAPGNYEYKITRGGWNKVECSKEGAGISNRTLNVEGDITIKLTVEAWQDFFTAKAKAKAGTASMNVKMMDTAFFIPQLNRKRKIAIYTPAGYAASGKRYPVLYLHDGQNVFDDATSFSGEWGVDEFLDTTMVKSCIVVAIDNGANKRINEYCPYNFSLKSLGLSQADTMNHGEGGLYVDFLVKTLKPYIDYHYRTLKNKSNTFIAGSSMGGLISMYALLEYPKVFGGAGVFSPAFWVGPKIFDDIKAKGKKVKAKIYFYAGKLEGERMVPDMLKALEAMMKVARSKITTVIRDDGKHNEATWRKEFPLFYEWVMK